MGISGFVEFVSALYVLNNSQSFLPHWSFNNAYITTISSYKLHLYFAIIFICMR